MTQADGENPYGTPSEAGPGPDQPQPPYGGTPYPSPGYGAPGYGAPEYGAPGYGQPHPAGPGYQQGGYGAPGYGQGGAPYGPPPPAYGAPGYGAPGYGAPGYGPPGYAPYDPNFPYRARPGTDDTTWAVLAHLGAIVFGFIPSLIIYLVKKDQSPYVRQQAAEALNFSFTVIIAEIASFVLVVITLLAGFPIGFLFWIGVGIAALVFAILAAVATGRGDSYRYPINIRMVH